jgi:hypothetical protein
MQAGSAGGPGEQDADGPDKDSANDNG